MYGYLFNYKLVFNHFGMYGNVIPKDNSITQGTIININENNLNRLIRKEFMYDIIKVNVKYIKGIDLGIANSNDWGIIKINNDDKKMPKPTI